MNYYDFCCFSSEGLKIFDNYCNPSWTGANTSPTHTPHIESRLPQKNHLKRKIEINENETQNKKEKIEKSRRNERQRSYDINEAFQTLQNVIPYVPDGLRLPKVKTLRLAITYIDYLNEILNNEQYCRGSKPRDNVETIEEQMSGRKRIKLSNFAHIVQAEIQSRNSYTERAKELVQNAKNQKPDIRHRILDHTPGASPDIRRSNLSHGHY